jgi:cyclophilin family peptidyl-prolyl cis-trans isomerase
MANDNAPHTNRAQFFMTLAPCEWLHKKHTVFGKVTGNTIFNMLRMGEADTDDKDRPLEKIMFLKAEVIWNPFDDIIPRFVQIFLFMFEFSGLSTLLCLFRDLSSVSKRSNQTDISAPPQPSKEKVIAAHKDTYSSYSSENDAYRRSRIRNCFHSAMI